MGRKEKKVAEPSLQGVYEYLSYEIQALKTEISESFKMHQTAENQSNNYLGMQVTALNKELEERLKKTMTAVSQEIRFSYKQNQTIYDGLSKSISKDIVEKLQAMEEQLAALEQLQAIAQAIEEVKANGAQTQASCDAISAQISGDVNSKLDALSEKQAKLEEIQTVLADSKVSFPRKKTIISLLNRSTKKRRKQVLRFLTQLRQSPRQKTLITTVSL